MTGRRVKKFYATVSVEPRGSVFAILLDGKPAKTPARADLAVPSRALADAMAQEWRGEGDTVDFDALGLTRLATTAIDLGERDRERWIDDVVGYLKSDLLCYRAEEPDALVQCQATAWTPYLDWAERTLQAPLRVTSGVTHIPQDESVTRAARERLSALDSWRIIGGKSATEITGSAVLALALEARAFPAKEIFSASRLDETFQAERWGVDAEAAQREARLERAFLAVDRWFALLGATA